MKNELDFYRNLPDTPPLPPELYSRVRKRIGRRKAVVRSFLALAAALVMAIGTAGVLATLNGTSAALSSDITSELQSIHEFCNSDDLGQEFESCSLYDEELTN